MPETTIEWTDRTWNPVRGCSRISPGCVHCYAERHAGRFCNGHKVIYDGDGMPGNITTVGPPGPFHLFAERRSDGAHWTGKVDLIEDKLLEPLSWRKPCRVFVNSMSDLFHENLPDEAIDRVFAVMALTPHITYQVLTKRADRMREYFGPSEEAGGMTRDVFVEGQAQSLYEKRTGEDPSMWLAVHWPLPNVWLGVSVEDQQRADERIPHLLATPAAKRFVSYEPALGPVDFNRIKNERGWFLQSVSGVIGVPDFKVSGKCLDWLIIGGESGPGARPFDIAWARQTVKQCKAAGVACFVKQLGARPKAPFEDDPTGRYYMKLKDKKGGDMAEWPEDLRVREFPR